MSLRGNLKEFNISDIFQLLSLGHKTGALKVMGDEEGYIYFKNGECYFATSTKYRKPIGQRLVEAGLISKSDLNKVLRTQKEEHSGRRLGRILLDQGLIDSKSLESFIKEQIWDAFLDILSWEEGEFDFEAGKVLTEEDVGITFETWDKVVKSIPSFEKILKSEQWAKIKATIPNFDVVFALDQNRATDVVGISLTPSEWGLVCIIDGKKTVAELMKEFDRDNFQIGYTLYKLLKAGLIVEVGDRKTSVAEAVSQKKNELDEQHVYVLKEEERLQTAVKSGNGEKREKEVKKEKVVPEEEMESEPPKPVGDRAQLKVRDKVKTGVKKSKESTKKATVKEVPSGSMEIKPLGNLEVWLGKEKRIADLFIIKKGEIASNVLRFPDGKYQFVHDRFSPEEKKLIVDKISRLKK